MRALYITILLFSLQSCMLLDFIKPSSGISVDTEVVAGDKEINTEVTGTKETTTNTADAITQTYNNVNEAYPWWVLVLLILGWVSPTPTRMWKGLVGLLPWK